MKKEVRKVNLLKPFNIGKTTIEKDSYFLGAYLIDFPLDSMPDHVWLDIFERVWKTSIHLWDRKMFIVGDKLRLITTPNEFEDKLDWVEQVLKDANKKVDEYNRAARLEKLTKLKEEMQKQRVWEERGNIELMKEMLRKRFG